MFDQGGGKETFVQPSLFDLVIRGEREMAGVATTADLGHIPTVDPDGSLRFLYNFEPTLATLTKEQALGLIRNIIAIITKGDINLSILDFDPVHPIKPDNMRVILEFESPNKDPLYEDRAGDGANGSELDWDGLDGSDSKRILEASQWLSATYHLADSPLQSSDGGLSEGDPTIEDEVNAINDLHKSVIYALVEPRLRYRSIPFTPKVLQFLDKKYSEKDRSYTLKIWDKWYVLSFKTDEVRNVFNLPFRGYTVHCGEATSLEVLKGESLHRIEIKTHEDTSYVPLNVDFLESVYDLRVDQEDVDSLNPEGWRAYATWKGEFPEKIFAVLIIDPKSGHVAKKLLYRIGQDDTDRKAELIGVWLFQYGPSGDFWIDTEMSSGYYKYYYNWDKVRSKWNLEHLESRISYFSLLRDILIPVQDVEEIQFEIVHDERKQPSFLETFMRRFVQGSVQIFKRDRTGLMTKASSKGANDDFPPLTSLLYFPRKKWFLPIESFLEKGGWDEFQRFYNV